MGESAVIAVCACGGALVAALLACIPGLHVYNVMGLGVMLWHTCGTHPLAPGMVVATAIGLVTGYAVLSAVPAVLLAAPDESAVFTVLPGQKMLQRGHGFDAVILTALGSLAGAALLAAVLYPLGPRLLPTVYRVVQPHQHWILWSVIVFMLLSEWPREQVYGRAGRQRLAAAWRPLGMGLLAFLLSGLLGFLLLYRSPMAPGVAFQNLMPAFIGLFTIPGLLLNIISATRIPAQGTGMQCRPRVRSVMHGILAGTLGGGFAAFFPAVTGGVGGFLAGHATALRDDEAFLVSQGTSRLVYYVGGLLLLFLPGLGLTRGGAAAMLRGMRTEAGPADYHVAMAAMVLATAVACLLLPLLTRAMLRVIDAGRFRTVSVIALLLVLVLVAATTGGAGLAVATVATGIGLIPPLFGSRRMNCLGVILLPLACGMSGVGAAVAAFLGLNGGL